MFNDAIQFEHHCQRLHKQAFRTALSQAKPGSLPYLECDKCLEFVAVFADEARKHAFGTDFRCRSAMVRDETYGHGRVKKCNDICDECLHEDDSDNEDADEIVTEGHSEPAEEVEEAGSVQKAIVPESHRQNEDDEELPAQ